jgi:hypothetical protein
MNTIAQGIESGDIKVGSKICVELEIKDILNNRFIALPSGGLETIHLWQSPFYTKPIEVPTNCELVAVPKIGTKWKVDGSVLTAEEIKVVSRNGIRNVDSEILSIFLKKNKPITKRTVTKAEAEELLAKLGEEVSIV